MDTTAGKKPCPLDNKCLTPSIIYKAQISKNTKHKKYLDAAETLFKERYSNHTQDLKHKNYMECDELSEYTRSLKNQGMTPIVKWRIVKKINSKVSPNYCKLCWVEIFFIIKSLDDCNLLNKRYELVRNCRHQKSCHYAM